MGTDEAGWEISENRWQIFLLSVGILLILLLGLLPQTYMPILTAIGPF
jgi:hypothetical protein